jgi:hypothetical protein
MSFCGDGLRASAFGVRFFNQKAVNNLAFFQKMPILIPPQ